MKTFKKIALYSFISVAGLVLISIFIAIALPDVEEKKVTNHSEDTNSKIEDKSIKGLMPVDVYLNFENNGFKTKTYHGNGSFVWTSVNEADDISMEVSVYSRDIEKVERVTLYGTVFPPQKPEALQDFFKYGCTIPYDGSEPTTAQNWLVNNYDKDSTSTVIGGAVFTLKAPTDFVRILTIEKE